MNRHWTKTIGRADKYWTHSSRHLKRYYCEGKSFKVKEIPEQIMVNCRYWSFLHWTIPALTFLPTGQNQQQFASMVLENMQFNTHLLSLTFCDFPMSLMSTLLGCTSLQELYIRGMCINQQETNDHKLIHTVQHSLPNLTRLEYGYEYCNNQVLLLSLLHAAPNLTSLTAQLLTATAPPDPLIIDALCQLQQLIEFKGAFWPIEQLSVLQQEQLQQSSFGTHLQSYSISVASLNHDAVYLTQSGLLSLRQLECLDSVMLQQVLQMICSLSEPLWNLRQINLTDWICNDNQNELYRKAFALLPNITSCSLQGRMIEVDFQSIRLRTVVDSLHSTLQILKIQVCSLTRDENVTVLSSLLKQCSQLRELHLNLQHVDTCAYNQFEQFLYSIIGSCTHLRYLEVQFGGSKHLFECRLLAKQFPDIFINVTQEIIH